MRAAQKRAVGAKLIGAAQAFGGVFGDAGLADGVGIAPVAQFPFGAFDLIDLVDLFVFPG